MYKATWNIYMCRFQVVGLANIFLDLPGIIFRSQLSKLKMILGIRPKCEINSITLCQLTVCWLRPRDINSFKFYSNLRLWLQLKLTQIHCNVLQTGASDYPIYCQSTHSEICKFSGKDIQRFAVQRLSVQNSQQIQALVISQMKTSKQKYFTFTLIPL